MQNSNTPAPLRVGIIGLGWSGKTQLEAYTKIPGVTVVALADPRQERLQELNALHPVDTLYTDFRDLLAHDDIDIVNVATPNHLHAPISIAALESGKHVICEKPLARNSIEGGQMVQAAIANQRALDVTFSHRQRGDVQVLKHIIDEGRLGKIYHAKASWMRRNGIPGMGGWFTTHELAGGGPLIDLGVHVLDMALYLMGEPEVLSVSAATYSELGPRGRGARRAAVGTAAYDVEDLATAFIRLGDGRTLLLEASWATYSKVSDEFGVALYGSDGGADIHIKDYVWQDTLRIYTDVGGVPADIAPQVKRGKGHLGVLQNFVALIRSGDWTDHVGREALVRTQIIDACYQSAREGREIRLSELQTPVT